MKFTNLIAIFAIGIFAIACNNQKGTQSNLETVKDSTSYAFGALQAEGFLGQLERLQAKQFLDDDRFIQGMQDAIKDTVLITQQQVQVMLTPVFQGIRSDSSFTLPAATQGNKLQNLTDSFGYALGTEIVGMVEKGIEQYQIEEEIEMPVAYDAIEDVITDSSMLSQQTNRTLLQQMGQRAQEKRMAANKEKYADNKKAGEEFLAKNVKKSEVKETESGLQYEVIKEGTGKSPSATDKVKVHYHGTLIDGTVFESSVEQGEPVSFPLNRVIPGWTEGVQLMKEGGKYKFYIKPELAYGGQEKGSIKPYSTLIFEIELLEVMENDSKGKQQPQINVQQKQ